MLTYEEKLNLIIQSIYEAEKIARKNTLPKLYINQESPLSQINSQEIHDILLKLQDDEKVIIIENIPTKLKSIFEQVTKNELLFPTLYFTIKVLPAFHKKYQYHPKTILQTQPSKIKITFHKTTNTLTINNKTIKFRKDSFRTNLLLTVLTNSSKEWSWDEIIEAIEKPSDDTLFENKDKYIDKFYHACKGINIRIAETSNISDLLIFSKKSVSLNPKYTDYIQVKVD